MLSDQGAAGTPAAQGFRMPPEWAPHQATWLAWPHDPLTWVNGIEPAETAFTEMITALVPGERVELLVRDEAMAHDVASRCTELGIDVAQAPFRTARDGSATPLEDAQAPEKDAGLVRLHVVGHQDSWVRDYGPTFLVEPQARGLGAVDWAFNAWGNKYETLIADDLLGHYISDVAGAHRFRVDAVMEGGAIETNGAGTVLTTEACLLNENRNPELDRADVEALLRGYLGCDQVLWLGDGIVGDDTDGHVDDIARFVSPGRIAVAVEEDEASPNHAPLQETLERLSKMTDQDGAGFELVELPMPDPVAYEGEPLPASYANFYIGNAAVLLPVYDDPKDEAAATVVASLFPNREVVEIPARDLIVGMGACHCLTQQQPAT